MQKLFLIARIRSVYANRAQKRFRRTTRKYTSCTGLRRSSRPAHARPYCVYNTVSCLYSGIPRRIKRKYLCRILFPTPIGCASDSRAMLRLRWARTLTAAAWRDGRGTDTGLAESMIESCKETGKGTTRGTPVAASEQSTTCTMA